MKATDNKSNVFRRTKEGYRKYCIKLEKWSEFLYHEQFYELIIADDEDEFIEEKYNVTYEFLENNQVLILDVLEEYCLKEYNYSREFDIKECRKCYLEELLKSKPEIKDRSTAVHFFRLMKILILPYAKECDPYIIFNIRVILTEDKSKDYENFEFAIILCKNRFVAAIDTDYNAEYLKEITSKDKRGEKLEYLTSMHMDYNYHVMKMERKWNCIDYSKIFFRGRSILGKYKELLQYTSCIGLEECDDRNRDCGIPFGSKIIGRLGVDGIFFFIVKHLGIKKEESPIYVVSPMNFECYIAPVARNLLEFISLGVACRNFGMLESISTSDKVDIEEQLAELDDDPNIKELIAIIQKNFPIIPIDDPSDYVKHIQSDETLKAETKKLQKYILRKLGLDE